MSPLATRALVAIAVVGVLLTFWEQSRLTSYRPSDVFRAPFAPSLNLSSSQAISRRVVAVADLHGDLEHAHNVLRMAKLIDGADPPNWIAGHDILVSTGDIVDRGDDTIALYHMFMRLRRQAQAAGGEVRNCLGNHEMMNALMDWRYVTPGDIDSFGGRVERRQAMSASGWVGKEWMSHYNISHTVELLPQALVPSALQTVYSVPQANFVHGGIHPMWAQRGLDEINDVGHSLLRKALSAKRIDYLPDDATPEERNLYAEKGPLWYRGFALDEEAEVCDEAHDSRQLLGVRHLIMGQ